MMTKRRKDDAVCFITRFHPVVGMGAAQANGLKEEPSNRLIIINITLIIGLILNQSESKDF